MHYFEELKIACAVVYMLAICEECLSRGIYFLYPSSINEHLKSIPLLDTVNNVAMNIGVLIPPLRS